MKIYIVEQLDLMGFPVYIKYFQKLEQAKLDFHKRLKEEKHKDDFAKDEDLDYNNFKKNGLVREPEKLIFPTAILQADLAFWQTWSNENGTESDIVNNTLFIREVEVE